MNVCGYQNTGLHTNKINSQFLFKFNTKFGCLSAEGVSVVAIVSETVAFFITTMYNVRKCGLVGLGTMVASCRHVDEYSYILPSPSLSQIHYLPSLNVVTTSYMLQGSYLTLLRSYLFPSCS